MVIDFLPGITTLPEYKWHTRLTVIVPDMRRCFNLSVFSLLPRKRKGTRLWKQRRVHMDNETNWTISDLFLPSPSLHGYMGMKLFLHSKRESKNNFQAKSPNAWCKSLTEVQKGRKNGSHRITMNMLRVQVYFRLAENFCAPSKKAEVLMPPSSFGECISSRKNKNKRENIDFLICTGVQVMRNKLKWSNIE